MADISEFGKLRIDLLLKKYASAAYGMQVRSERGINWAEMDTIIEAGGHIIGLAHSQFSNEDARLICEPQQQVIQALWSILNCYIEWNLNDNCADIHRVAAWAVKIANLEQSINQRSKAMQRTANDKQELEQNNSQPKKRGISFPSL